MLKKLLLAALVLAASLCAPASYAAERFEIRSTTYYLTAKQQQFPKFTAPPAIGSKEDQSDLADVRGWQDKRTKEQCAEANAEAHADFDEFFGAVSPFPRPLPPAAAKVFKRVKGETDGIVGKIKDHYQRPRPFHRGPDFDPCLGKIGGLSYPSGHATIARMYALVLSGLLPERRAEFLARADEAALYRVIGGVHYPSDIEAGKRLSDAVYALYLKSPAFKKDLAVLRGSLLSRNKKNP